MPLKKLTHTEISMKQEFQHAIELRLFDDRIIYNQLITTTVG